MSTDSEGHITNTYDKLPISESIGIEGGQKSLCFLDLLGRKYGNVAVPNVLRIVRQGRACEAAIAAYYPLSKEETKTITSKLAKIGVTYSSNSSGEIKKLTKFDDISDIFSKFSAVAAGLSTSDTSNKFEGKLFVSPDLHSYPVASNDNFKGAVDEIEFDFTAKLGDLDVYDFDTEILSYLPRMIDMFPKETGKGGWEVPIPTVNGILYGLVSHTLNTNALSEIKENFSVLDIVKGGTSLSDTLDKISNASQAIKESLSSVLYNNSSIDRYMLQIGYVTNKCGPNLDGTDYTFFPIISSRTVAVSGAEVSWQIDDSRPILFIDKDCNIGSSYVGKDQDAIGYLPNMLNLKMKFKNIAVVPQGTVMYIPLNRNFIKGE